MTIIYQCRVATASLAGFGKLLLKWRGSVYKLMYKEIIIFSGIYTALSLCYRLLLSEPQRRVFERMALHCNTYTSLIPISFVLGFYVTLVVSRWWRQFQNLPWPDRTALMVHCYVTGQDERGRMLRRTVARYLVFSTVLILRSISVAAMKRFPTLDHVIQAGIATREDVDMFESVSCDYNKFWLPVIWANSLMATARKEGRIETDLGLRMITEQLADFRDKCSQCFMYDWVTVPLVYTQVVTLAVYMFFGACVIGRQFLDPTQGYENYDYDFYVPVFTLLQFFFYMGWLKVAEQLINPFGEDDDDFEVNWLIDRHISVSMTIVDQCYGQIPPLTRDLHWDETKISNLPYTEASRASKRPAFLGSTYSLPHLTAEEQRLVMPEKETSALPVSPRRRLSHQGSLLTRLSRSSIFKHPIRTSQDCLLTDAKQPTEPYGNVLTPRKTWPVNIQDRARLLVPPTIITTSASDNVGHLSRSQSGEEIGFVSEVLADGDESLKASEAFSWYSHPDLTHTEQLNNLDEHPLDIVHSDNSLQSDSSIQLNSVLHPDTALHPDSALLPESALHPDSALHPERALHPDTAMDFDRALSDGSHPRQAGARKYSCPANLTPSQIAPIWDGEKRRKGSLTVSRAPQLSSIDELDAKASDSDT
ncbi:bestrophin-4-like [Liolophura sinensis]|uniref:bestrophin-4-like n=1 Tax=Liolophura sinensis TaxID=3198878 RepID=UPI0031584324